MVLKTDATSADLKHSWIVDSGATSHLTHNEDWLENPTDVQVQLGTADGNASALIATRKGTVKCQVRTHSGRVVGLTLHNVLFCKTLCGNILSVGALKQQNIIADFKSDVIKWPKGTCVGVQWVNKLPYMHCIVPSSEGGVSEKGHQHIEHCSVATVQGAMELHLQYGHAGITALRQLHPEKIPSDMTTVKCPSCFMGSSSQLAFPSSVNSRAVRPLEIVHSDIWGPAPVLSRRGNRFLIGYTDDFSRKRIVYSIPRRKNLVLSIQKFVQQHGLPKILHTDNEYASNNLKEYALRVGMKIEKISPYAHQQAGVAERTWGVLSEKVHALVWCS